MPPNPPAGFEFEAGFVRSSSTGGLLVDPEGSQAVTGTITANQGSAGPAWKVDGSGVIQPVSGTVSVGNFPASQAVSGSVSVTNLPSVQPVSGTVTAGNLPSLNQDGTTPVRDEPIRRLLELMLLEARIHNEQLGVLTGRGRLEYPENQGGL